MIIINGLIISNSSVDILYHILSLIGAILVIICIPLILCTCLSDTTELKSNKVYAFTNIAIYTGLCNLCIFILVTARFPGGVFIIGMLHFGWLIISCLYLHYISSDIPILQV